MTTNEEVYFIVEEATVECEWDLFLISHGKKCRKVGEVAIVERYHNDELHIGHLCRPHGEQVFADMRYLNN